MFPRKLFQACQKNSGARGRNNRGNFINGDSMIEVIPLSAISIHPDKDSAVASPHWQISCVTCSPPSRQATTITAKTTTKSPLPPPPLSSRQATLSTSRRRRRRTPRYNSVSKIDRASRVVFPLFFLAINVFYWYAYLSRSERIRYYNSNTAWYAFIESCFFKFCKVLRMKIGNWKNSDNFLLQEWKEIKWTCKFCIITT